MALKSILAVYPDAKVAAELEAWRARPLVIKGYATILGFIYEGDVLTVGSHLYKPRLDRILYPILGALVDDPLRFPLCVGHDAPSGQIRYKLQHHR